MGHLPRRFGRVCTHCDRNSAGKRLHRQCGVPELRIYEPRKDSVLVRFRKDVIAQPNDFAVARRNRTQKVILADLSTVQE
jgi:hypothetical protein